jgi:hypothetical protein
LLQLSLGFKRINDLLSMPNIAPWAQPWVKKAISLDSKSAKINFAHRRLLRDCLLQSSSYLTSIGSNAFLSYSRIFSILCLRRAEAISLPKSENWALLKTLTLLFEFDNGYSLSLAHYIVDLLKLQPNTGSSDRNQLLKLFGQICRNLTISASDAKDLIQLAINTLPKPSIATPRKELAETGVMWSRIALSKLQLVPPSILKELTASLASLSLPKLLASKKSVEQCIYMVDIAFYLVHAMEKNKVDASSFKHDLERIHDLISSNIELLKKFNNAEELQIRSLRAVAEFNFDKVQSLLLDILKDGTGEKSPKAKENALKCLLRHIESHQTDTEMRNGLFSAASLHRASCHGCHLLPQIEQIEAMQVSSEINMGLLVPVPVDEIFFPALPNSAQLSSSPLSESDGQPMRIVCHLHKETIFAEENDVSETDPNLIASFFDDMNSTSAVLEAFNRSTMATLQKLAILADFPDQQDRSFLSGLETELLHQIAHPEESSHTGLLQFVQRFMSRPLPQRELIMCILRAPKLLSNPLFLYHLSRVSLGFQAIASTLQAHAISANTQHQQQQQQLHSGAQPTPIVVESVLPSEDEDAQEKLRKRKALALKMVDDLEEEEFRVAKRPSPLSMGPLAVNRHLNSNEMNGSSSNVTVRHTRSKSGSNQTSSPPSLSANSLPPSLDITSVNSSSMDIDTPIPNAKKVATKKAKQTSSKATAATTSSSKEKSSKAKAKQKKEPEPRKVCHHWIQHKCYRGDECPFLHEGVQTSFDTICKFFRTGSCTKGSSCPYSHDLKAEACANLVSQGTCKYGDRCAYSHDSEKIATAKRIAEEKARQEALEKAEREKSSQLPFSHFIVPLSVNEVSSLGTINATALSSATQESAHIDSIATTDHKDSDTSAPLLSTPAYVPPSLSTLLQSNLSGSLIATPLASAPIASPKLIPPKPPSLID